MSLGLYVHIPFCIKKCKYCDFISFCNKEDSFDKYISCVLKEAQQYNGQEIDTVFLGGGTPSILNSSQLATLISGLRKIFDFSANTEFTIEANPKTLDFEKLSILKLHGVNRISIGVQSFNDDELLKIGRIHNSQIAYNTVNMVKEAGFDNFNIDIMLNLPGQTKQSLENTLKTCIDLSPTHLSCYSLILEEGTPLYYEYERGIYTEPDDEYDRELYHFTNAFLKANGYNRYEISNFSKNGYECRHNLKYWNCDEYIGLGISAHSYQDGKRFYNTSDLFEYLSEDFSPVEVLNLSYADKISEYMIMRLRLLEGIFCDDFFKRFGKRIEEIYPKQLEKLTKNKLLINTDGYYRLSDYGIDISNTVLCEFVWFCTNFMYIVFILWTICKNGFKILKNTWHLCLKVVFYIC